MKTNYASRSLIITGMIIAMFLTALSTRSFGTGKSPFIRLSGVGLASTVSGNHFGLQHTAYTSLQLGNRLEIMGGPVFRKSFDRMTGFSGSLRCAIILPDDSYSGCTTLYNLISFRTHNNQGFSDNWMEIENFVAQKMRENVFDYSALRFKGSQVTLGFGVERMFADAFALHFNIGVTKYWMKRTNYTDIPLYYETSNMGLYLSAGIKINLGRK